MQRRAKKICDIKVNVHGKGAKFLAVYEGQVPAEIAHFFCKANGIDDIKKQEKLVHLIEEKIQECKEQEIMFR